MTADEIALAGHEKFDNETRSMHRKYEAIGTGEPEEIGTKKHQMDLVQSPKPFQSPPYRASPKTRYLIRFKVKKQLKAG